MKVTQWFDAGVKPVKIGVYEVDDEDNCYSNLRWFAYFDGKKFCYRCDRYPDEAYQERSSQTFLPALPKWRGLAIKPI